MKLQWEVHPHVKFKAWGVWFYTDEAEEGLILALVLTFGRRELTFYLTERGLID